MARDRNIEKLSDLHLQKLQGSLQELENRVIVEAAKLPKGGTLTLRTTAALELRPKLKQYIEETFLTTVQTNIEEYDQVASWLVRDFKKFPIPAEFKQITELDLTVIQQLKRASYIPYEDLANEFVNTLDGQIYNSMLTGSSKEELISNLKGTINGVYQSTDNEEASELIDFINENPNSPQKQSAIDRLHTIYGRDRLGNNLRRYANQIAQDSIMSFDGLFAKYRADELGLKHYRYSGTSIRDSRPFCKKNVGKIFSEDQIKKIWGTTTWEGKAQGDPFAVRGGYNCRHNWQPVDPSWDLD